MSNENLISLLSGLIGAIIGAYWVAIGAGFGALVAWFIPFVAIRLTDSYRLKQKILRTLSTTELKQVRDIMTAHGISVPTDCFVYENTHPFVSALAKYRKTLLELEEENKIIY